MLDRLRFGPEWPFLVEHRCCAFYAALTVLWLKRRSMLDLWLMVVMVLYLIEVPLSYYPMPMRFSGGWYARTSIRIPLQQPGPDRSSLRDTNALRQAAWRGAGATTRARGSADDRGAVAASMAHEMRQPLTAMVTTADAGLRFLDRQMPNLDRAKQAFRNIVSDGHRAGAVVATSAPISKVTYARERRSTSTSLSKKPLHS